MDGAYSVGKDNPSTDSKKNQGALESLSHEELVVKCKHLIDISKKAKEAKDDAVAIVKQIKCENATAIRALEEERNKLESEADNLKELSNDFSEVKEVLSNKTESLQRQLQLLTGENEQMKNVELTLMDTHHTLSLENDKLKTAVHKQQRVVEQLREEREKRKEQMHFQWLDEKAALMGKVEAFEAALGQMDLLKESFRNLTRENDELVKSEKISASTVAELKQEKLGNDIVLQQMKKDLQVLNNLNDEQKRKFHVIEVEAKSSRDEIDGLSVMNKDLNCELLECRNKLKLMMDKDDNYNKEMENLKEMVEDYKSELDCINEKYTFKEKECCNLKNEIDELKSELSKYIDNLKAQNDKNEGLCNKKERLIEELQKSESELKEINNKVGISAEDKVNFESEIDGLRSELIVCKEELDRIKRENNSIDNDRTKLLKDIDASNLELKSIKEKFDLNEEERNNFFVIKNVEILDLTEKLKNARNEIELTQEVFDKKENDLLKKIDNYQKEIKDLGKSNGVIVNLREEISTLEEKLCSFENLKSELSEKGKEIESVNIILKSTLEEKESMRLENIHLIEESNSRVNDLKDELSNLYSVKDDVDSLIRFVDERFTFYMPLDYDISVTDSSVHIELLEMIMDKLADYLFSLFEKYLEQSFDIIKYFECLDSFLHEGSECDKDMSQKSANSFLDKQISNLKSLSSSLQHDLPENLLKKLDSSVLVVSKIIEKIKNTNDKIKNMCAKLNGLKEIEISNDHLINENERLINDIKLLKKQSESICENEIYIKNILTEKEEAIENELKLKCDFDNYKKKMAAECEILRKEIDNISDLKQEHHNFSVIIPKLKREIEVKNEGYMILYEENERNSSKVDILREEIDRLERINDKLKADHISDIEILEKQDENIKTMTQQNENFSKLVPKLKRETQVKGEDYLIMSKEMDSLKHRYDNLKMYDDELEVKHTSSLESLKSMTKEIEAYKERITENEKIMKQENEKIQNLTEENEEFSLLVPKLKREIEIKSESFINQTDELDRLEKMADNQKAVYDELAIEHSSCLESLKLITKELDNLKISNMNLTKDEVVKMKDSFEVEKTKLMANFENSISESNSQILALQSENISLSSKLDQVKNKMENLGELLKQTKEDLDESNSKVKKMHLVKKEFDEIESELKLSNAKKNSQIEELTIERGKLEEQINLNSTEIEVLQTDVENKNQVILHKDVEIKEFEEIINSLQADVNLTKENEIKSKEECEASSNRCQEMLLELNQINQVLRERGEKISRLEEINTENKKKIDEKEKEMGEKVSCLEAKIAVIKVEPLKSSAPTVSSSIGASQHINDNQSEVMSTSTISKADEGHRMRELEDTFEERFMKLKSVAIKLKRRLAEQSLELKESEDARKKLLNAESRNRENSFASKNIQALQGEIDRLQDCLDAEKKTIKERGKELLNSVQEVSDLKTKLAETQEEICQLKIQNQHDEQEKENLKGEISCLKANCIEYEEKLKHEMDLNRGREAEIEKWKRLEKEIEETKQASMNHSLIDLELKDYERTVAELNEQISLKEKSLEEKTLLLSNAKDIGESLKGQMKLMEASTVLERERADKLKQVNTELKANLEDVHQKEENLRMEKLVDRDALEKLTQELENYKLSTSELSATSSQTESILREQKNLAELRLEEADENVKLLNSELSTLQLELKQVKDDFDGYKLRAQSVLRQKSGQQSTTDVDLLKNEIDQLTEELERSITKNHQIRSDLSSCKAELGYLTLEKERLTKLVHSITKDKEKLMNDFLERESKKDAEMENKCGQLRNAIAKMAHQNEDMDKNFKAQFEIQEKSHTKEILSLKSQLSELVEQQSDKMKAVVIGTHSESSDALIEKEKEENKKKAEESRLWDVANMIREDGEGSEWVEPPTHRHSRYSPPPLHQLIGGPLPPNPYGMDDSMSITSAVTEASAKDLQKLENKISVLDTRLFHLTGLLTESEGENSRLSQLTNVLKEEIRRGQRNESREVHLDKGEYVKNVVLKFLVLKNGDEKSRLVPVLKTILQLSPEEVKQLASIAQGDDGRPENQQGWGGYLHVWSAR